MIALKKMQIKTEQLKEGDIVITEDQETFYVILEINYTFWNRHKYIIVGYPNGHTTKWFLDELNPTKTIYRPTNEVTK
jgi:hypothetical protein